MWSILQNSHEETKKIFEKINMEYIIDFFKKIINGTL